MIHVVTGARDHSRDQDARYWLSTLKEAPYWIIAGGATGVDQVTREVSLAKGWRFIEIPAPWDARKLKAGPVRNGWMLAAAIRLKAAPDKNHIVCVEAFPGPRSKGTWSCIKLAQKLDVKVNVHQMRNEVTR